MQSAKQFRHHTPIQIRFNDLDILGHVNNAVYQHYFDLARMEYFSEVIGFNLDWKKFGVIMAGISIDYFKPVKINDSVSVRSRVVRIGEKSLTMNQEIYHSETGEIKCSNRATMVGFSMEKNHTMEIPSAWKEQIFYFEGKLTVKNPV